MLKLQAKLKLIAQRMRRHLLGLVLVLCSYPLITISYQSCEGFQLATLEQSSLSNGRIDPDCLENGTAGACIFLANPVATLKQSLEAPEDLGRAQIYAIQLPARQLANSLVIIAPSSVPRAVPMGSGNWRYRMSGKPEAVEQIHAFYWSTVFLDQMTQSLGAKLPTHFPITIDTHSEATSDILVMPKESTIKLGRTLPAGVNRTSERIAVSADILVEGLGQILATRLNPGLETYSTTTHSECSNLTTCSCKTAEGCGASLILGTATLFRHLFFSQYGHTSMGDNIVNQYGGAQYCGLSTDLSQWTVVSKETAFAACSEMYDFNAANAYSLGLVFAAIWAPLFDPVLSPGVLPTEVLDLLATALVEAPADDTLVSFFRRVETIDQNKFNGHYGPLLRERLTLHGVQL